MPFGVWCREKEGTLCLLKQTTYILGVWLRVETAPFLCVLSENESLFSFDFSTLSSFSLLLSTCSSLFVYSLHSSAHSHKTTEKQRKIIKKIYSVSYKSQKQISFSTPYSYIHTHLQFCYINSIAVLFATSLLIFFEDSWISSRQWGLLSLL